MFRVLRQRPHAEHFLRRPCVDIFTVAESLDEHGVFRKVRHDAQLDLRVVRGQQYLSFLGDEGGANLAPQLAPYRNVLQIGIARTEPSGGRAGLRKASVQTSGCGMNQFRKRVHVSRFELGNFAVFDDLSRKLMLRGQFLENVRGGRPRFGFSAPRVGLKIQFVEKNFGELRWGVDVEFRARKLPDLFLQVANFLLHRLGHFAELLGVDADASPLYIRKHRRKRQVDLFIHTVQFLFPDLFVKHRYEALQVIGALSGAASEHDVELAHHHVPEIVIRGCGPEQIRKKLSGMPDVYRSARQQLKQFWIVDDLQPPRIAEEWRERLQRVALFVEPDGAPFTGLRRDFDRCDTPPKSFRFAFARVEIQPDCQRLLGRELG